MATEKTFHELFTNEEIEEIMSFFGFRKKNEDKQNGY